MTDLFWEGLSLSVVGITLTFLALGLLILAMVVLERAFRATAPNAQRATSLATPHRPTDAAAEEIAAAIAVALTIAQSRAGRPHNLGAALREARGPWWRHPRRSSRMPKTAGEDTR